MGLFTIRQKQQMIVAAIPIILGLALLSLLIKFWYITVPIVVVLVGLFAWRVSVVRRREAELRDGSGYVTAHTHIPRPTNIDQAPPDAGETSDPTS